MTAPRGNVLHDSGPDVLTVMLGGADFQRLKRLPADAQALAIADVARWDAYKRWLLRTDLSGPRMDITDDASLDAFADALIKAELMEERA